MHKWLKQELRKHFDEEITITNIPGKPNVLTFRTTAAKILKDFHSSTPDDPSATDPETEKIRIIEAAAKII